METDVQDSIHTPTRADTVLRLALDVGEAMLRAGGEISRVENTIERICGVYGAAHIEVFSLPSMIIASVRLSDGEFSSQMRRVRSTANDLASLERFNQISRQVCTQPVPLCEFDQMVKAAKKRRIYPKWLLVLCAALAVGSFTVFFGGGVRDFFVAALIGGVMQLIDSTPLPFLNPMAKLCVNSFVAGMLACLFVLLGVGADASAIILGTVMLLIPGLVFGNAIRSLLFGDLLSGSLEIVRAVLSAFMIALGYCLSMFLAGQGILPPAGLGTPLFQFIGATVGCLGFAIIFSTHPRHLLPVGLGGLLTYGVYYLATFFGIGPFLAALFSALFFALYSEILARILHAPAIVFSAPCAMPIVPGGFLYNAMVALIGQNPTDATAYVMTAVQVGLGMACGIVAVSILFGLVNYLAAKVRAKRAL